jgi:imidazolonepropionase-like amidohydrolase
MKMRHAFFSFALLPVAALAGEKTVLKAARLIDGKGGVIAPAVVLVDADRIAGVGANMQTPDGARVIGFEKMCNETL